VILEEGLKKKPNKQKTKSRPTDPDFEDHAIGNTHIFFVGLIIFFLRMIHTVEFVYNEIRLIAK
jgi:hypothetical protein